MRGAQRLDRAHRWSWTCMGVVLLLASHGCGGGKGGKDFDFQPGTTFDTAPADRVMVVVEAKNECGGGSGGGRGACVTPPPGPCTFGDGNTRGLAIYRLGPNGLLYNDPSGGLAAPGPEALVATDDNPRRIVSHPDDPTLVYVATNKRVQTFRLAPNGGSRCLGQTTSETEVDPGFKDLDATDMVIDPTVGPNGILYVASRGAERVDAYLIADDGTIPNVPNDCIIGERDSEYESVSLVTSGFIAAAGRQRVEVYARQNGFFPLPTITPDPDATPTPTVEASPTPEASATPSPAPTCIGAVAVTSFVSSIGAARVTDLLFQPSIGEPLGQMLIAEEGSQRLFTFPIDAEGEIDGDDSSRTNRIGVFERVLRLDRNGTSLLYATVFDKGRVDVFPLVDNVFDGDETISRTEQGVNSLPVELAVDGDGTILYVTQAGFNRVDGFQLNPDGTIADSPLTSTAAAFAVDDGRPIDSFPDDLVFVPFP